MRSLLATAVSMAAVALATCAQAQSPTIQDLMALREIGTHRAGLSLSPDGAWLAFFQAEETDDLAGGRYTLLLMPATATESTPRVIGDGGGLLLHDEGGRRSGIWLDRVVRWAPDSRSVAYIAERDGRAELWTSDLQGRSRMLATTSGDVRDFRWLSTNEILLNLDTPRATLAAMRDVQDRDGFLVTDDFDATFSLTPNPDVDSGRSYQTLDVRSGRLRAARTGADEAFARAAADAPRIGALDPASAAYRPAQALYAPVDGQEVRCAAEQCSGRIRETGRVGDMIWFTRGEAVADGDTATYLWTPRSQALRLLRVADERLLGCVGNTTHLFCLRESPAEPRHVVAIVLSTGAMTTIYQPNPQWARMRLPQIERIAFRDADGNESYAHLVYPEAYAPGRAYPMVIVQYRSRGFLRGGTGGEFPIFPLAARGYVVMSVERPEARGLEERVTRLEYDRRQLLGDGEERIKIDSLEGLIRQVAQRGLVDEDRIAITGMSDGAETLFWALRQRRFAAAVSSTPPTDPVTWWLWSEDYRESLDWGPFDPGIGEMNPWWRHNAPRFYAEPIRTPLLMNLSQSEALSGLPFYAHQRGTAPIEVFIYPGAYHTKWRPSQLAMAQARAMDWIDFWLMDRETPDPRDPDRYARWRALRQTHAAQP